MVSYEAITHAEDDVVGALQREGGELSYPELVSVTKLPYEIVSEVLENLSSEERVQITPMGEEGSEVRLVRLRTSPFAARFATWLGA